MVPGCQHKLVPGLTPVPAGTLMGAVGAVEARLAAWNTSWRN